MRGRSRWREVMVRREGFWGGGGGGGDGRGGGGRF